MLHYSIMIRANSWNLTCMVQVVSLGVILPPLNTEENVVKRFSLTLLYMQRKRRSQLFLRSDKLATAFGLASKRLRNKPVKKLDIGHSYSPSSIDSCSSLNPTECLSVQTVLNSCSPRSIVSRKTLKQCIYAPFSNFFPG
jgi:hypothetical protein